MNVTINLWGKLIRTVTWLKMKLLSLKTSGGAREPNMTFLLGGSGYLELNAIHQTTRRSLM